MDFNTLPRKPHRGIQATRRRQSAPAGKVFLKTYGCQMNVYDSQRMSDALAADGYVTTEAVGDADLILLNTCHIREKAAEKVYSELGRLRKIKAERAEHGPPDDDRHRRLRRPGGRPGNHPPRARCRPGHRSADLSPAARGAGQGAAAAKRSSKPTMRSRTSSSICRSRRAARSRAAA